MNLTISNSNIHDNSVAGGSDGIQLEIRGTAQAFINIDGNQFSNNKSQAIQISALENSNMHATIQATRSPAARQGTKAYFWRMGAIPTVRTAIDQEQHHFRLRRRGDLRRAGTRPGHANSLLEATIQREHRHIPGDATNHAILAFVSS